MLRPTRLMNLFFIILLVLASSSSPENVSAQEQASGSESALLGALANSKTLEEHERVVTNYPNLSKAELLAILKKEANRLFKEGYYQRAELCYRLIERLANADGDKAEIANALQSLGNIHRASGHYKQALESYQRGMAISEELQDQRSVARAYNSIGDTYRIQKLFTQALEPLQKSLSVRERIDDQEGICLSLYSIGAVYLGQRNYEQGYQVLQKSLALAERRQDRVAMAQALNAIGEGKRDQGLFPEAMENYRLSLKLSEEAQDKPNIATALSNMGIVYRLRGELDQAQEYFTRAITIRKQLQDKRGLANTYNALAILLRFQNDEAQALEYYRLSLALGEELSDPGIIATAFYNIGNLLQSNGDYQQALIYYQRSAKVRKTIDDKKGLNSIITAIGRLYELQGRHALALSQFEQALQMGQELKDKRATALALNNIATVYLLLGDNDKARSYFQQSLKLREELGERQAVASTLDNLGSVYHAQRDYARAHEHFRASLLISEKVPDKKLIARTLTNLGSLYISERNYEPALAGSARAVDVARATGDPDLLWRALSVKGIACRNLNRGADSLAALQEAIRVIEGQRGQTAGTEADISYFFEDRIAPYHELISLLVTERRYEEALAYAEQTKARVIFDVLQNGKININRSMSAQEQTQEKALLRELARLNSQWFREQQREQADAATLADLSARLDKARLELERFHTSLYATHPELRVKRADLPALKVDEAIQLLPDANSALLEFVVTDTQTYLFVLTRRARNAPRAQPGELTIYPVAINRSDLIERVTEFRTMLAERNLAFQRPARELFDLLLKPAERQLAGKSTLIIVPAGVLWDLPFQALKTSQNRYLLEACRLYYAPSLAALREMAKSRPGKNGAAGMTLLAVGDPALPADARPLGASAQLGDDLGQLPAAAALAKELARIYGNSYSRLLIGADASEEQIKAALPSYKILQFATHGLLNNASPMYSHLVLSQAERAREDGLLEAWEILQMELQADLAVLAACETARGQIGFGEGVIGLSWAFFVAGCPSVIVSQWKVEDESTKDLMIEFHRLRRSPNRAGRPALTTAEALRQAALQVMRNGKDPHPFYWAGFVLVGNNQ